MDLPLERRRPRTARNFPKNQPRLVAANDDYILEILIENSLVTKDQVEDARSEMKAGKGVLQVLMDHNLITQEDVSRAGASNAAMDFVSLDGIIVSGDVLALIPPTHEAFVRRVPGRNLWLWYRQRGDELVLVAPTADPPVPLD